MSIPLLTVCGSCGRPSHLWGGAACDVCDRDNNGINDADELVGSGLTAIPSVLPVEEKGWEMLPGSVRSVGIPNGLSRNVELRALRVLQKKFRQVADSPMNVERSHAHVEGQQLSPERSRRLLETLDYQPGDDDWSGLNC